ncbi:MAG: thioredoxin-disulfide reductase [Lactobacillus sp.]|nr:thioredoxin-disulfide reductase [Lactobacillus sp.]MDN6052153.1 thioredoxin-disulfide reductase [Lactobacillus sp.]
MTKVYDVMIIGAGPAGMTAALYATRANLKVLLLDRGPYGGQMNNTDVVDNYPGYLDIKGPELSEKMFQTLGKFQPDFEYGDVQKVTLDGDNKVVTTDTGAYTAPVLIIASGATHRHLGVPGEEDYAGRGVSYCAVCDGAFFKDEDVAVVGGGDSALEEGLYLAQLAKSVTIIHRRDQLRAQPWLQGLAKQNDKVHFVWNALTDEIAGDGQKVSGVHYHDKLTDKGGVVPATGVFIYVGIEPQTSVFKELGITNEAGWIDTDENMRTTLAGVYAVGDVRDKHLRQIANAVGDGSIAGQDAFSYLQKIKHNN